DLTPCGTHSIMLIVRDGSSFSKDFVEVTVDMPTVTYYRDVDGDGFGDDNITIESCVPLPGYVTIGGDCDDTNSAIHPDAIEVENGVDNNCDGIIDNVITSIDSEVEENLLTVEVYPIPFEQLLYIYIESSDKTERTSLRIYNNIGLLMDVVKDVPTEKTHTFGEEYAEGLYLIEVEQGKNRKIVKAIKK
ncbi:MAG TPA: MopE-related protein, partial [Marinilabiliaceae bacterium]|nr:MopE-related protein [Marinilabiliaceae bacterium]